MSLFLSQERAAVWRKAREDKGAPNELFVRVYNVNEDRMIWWRYKADLLACEIENVKIREEMSMEELSNVMGTLEFTAGIEKNMLEMG